ncbi:MAG TPA: PBP1A family penicillin-binding protein [Egibacteraceae bacterium]|nr:PBP1A family penicillin-binding protein [Egibacteraceae bacterium]
MLLGFAGLVLFFYFFTSVPLPDAIGATPTVILDTNGVEVGTLQAETSREDIDLDDLPEHVVHAVLAAEDATFYEHRGVSLPGIFRAAIRNVASGEVSQGGSTISQQYVKNITTDKEKTVLRKVREAALAVKLEQNYSKDQILEFYLNSIYWGRGAYGIEAAAKAYFDKPARKLGPGQAALLAGVIAAPSAYDPTDNPDKAHARYRYVLDQMVEKGWMEPMRAGSLAAKPPATRRSKSVVFKQAPFFLQLVKQELERNKELEADEIYRGLVVTTTLDVEMQAKAEKSYREAFVESKIKPSAALVAIDNATGGVRALVGGKNYAKSELNLAVGEGRQPGSTFKPFALAAWIAENKSPDSYFDAPGELEFSASEINDKLGREQALEPWKVRNYADAAYGEMSLREATWKSVNTVYAQLVLEVDPKDMRDIAEDAGIKRKLDAVPALVLGTEEVTPLQLTEAYSTFATGGVHRKAHTVAEIRRDGETIFKARTKGDEAMEPKVALHVTDVLRGVIDQGTGMAANIGRPAAGKTGTTQSNGDAWFVGYTPQITATVWMGNVENNEPMEGEYTGGSLPAATWGDFMSAAMEDMEVEDFPPPPGGLDVVRPAPPSEEPCADGEVASESSDGDRVCVDEEPTETEAPQTEAPEETEAPEPEPEPEPSPKPSPKPSPSPEPQPEPSKSPKPKPTKSPAPDPVPEPTEDAAAASAEGG